MQLQSLNLVVSEVQTTLGKTVIKRPFGRYTFHEFTFAPLRFCGFDPVVVAIRGPNFAAVSFPFCCQVVALVLNLVLCLG